MGRLEGLGIQRGLRFRSLRDRHTRKPRDGSAAARSRRGAARESRYVAAIRNHIEL